MASPQKSHTSHKKREKLVKIVPKPIIKKANFNESVPLKVHPNEVISEILFGEESPTPVSKSDKRGGTRCSSKNEDIYSTQVIK